MTRQVIAIASRFCKKNLGGCIDKREVVIEFDEENEISVNSQVINDDLLQNHSPLTAQKIVLSHL